MADYTVWNTATGRIVRGGKSSHPDLQAGEGESVYIGGALDDMAWRFDVETGEPIEEAAEIPQDELGPAINRERQRRIEAGKDFGGVCVSGSDKDVSNLTNLALGAQLRISMGDMSTTTFRDGNNVDHQLSPPGIISLWMTASAYVSAIYEASWALKAMTPIPQDFADDNYWP